MTSDSAPLAARRRAVFGLFVAHLVGIVTIAATNILLGLTLLAAPWASDRRDLARGRALLLPLAAYLALAVVTMSFSYDPGRSWRAASDFFNLLVPVLALLVLRRERHVRLALAAVVTTGVAVAAFGLVQYANGWDSLAFRIRGPFSHYMTFSGVLTLCAVILLAWLVFGGGWRRWWAWLALALLLTAMLLSFTRNGWVALVVCLTLLALVRMPRLLLAWIPVVIVFLLFAPPGIRTRVGSIVDLHDPSNYDRLCMADAGLHMIAERPLFGHGPGMVAERYPIYRHPTAPRYWVKHLHNIYLNLGAERGLTSLLAFLWLVGASLARAWHGQRRDPARRDVYMATVTVLAAYLAMGFFEDYWTDTEVQRLLLFVAAVPFCLAPAPSASEEASAAAVRAEAKAA